MQNQKSRTSTKLLIAMALTVLVFVPISGQAFTVQVDGTGTNATGILNLPVQLEHSVTRSYNVVFRYDSGIDVYDDPPPFDFSGEIDPLSARSAVIDALNSVSAVETVGPGDGTNPTSSRFNIGFDRTPFPDLIAALVGQYSPDDWGVPDPGIDALGPSDSEFYADFTVVPIPAAVWLLGGGLIGLLGLRRRFKN